jgi:hypothetical protein
MREPDVNGITAIALYTQFIDILSPCKAPRSEFFAGFVIVVPKEEMLLSRKPSRKMVMTTQGKVPKDEDIITRFNHGLIVVY